MTISKENNFLKRTFSVKDYVQDGLISMYDGEWNAGDGKHDSTSGQIVNLVTGGKIGIGNGNAIAEKCVLFTTSNSNNLSLLDISKNKSFTIEAVVSKHDSATNAAALVLPYVLQNDNGFFVYPELNPGNMFVITCKTTMSVHHSLPAGSLHHVILLVNGDTFTVMAQRSGFKHNGVWINTPWSYNVGYFGKGNSLYSFRMYSRGLSEDEISRNYKIDKERFGL